MNRPGRESGALCEPLGYSQRLFLLFFDGNTLGIPITQRFVMYSQVSGIPSYIERRSTILDVYYNILEDGVDKTAILSEHTSEATLTTGLNSSPRKTREVTRKNSYSEGARFQIHCVIHISEIHVDFASYTICCVS